MLASKDDPCSPLDQLESLASRKDLLENYPQLAKLLHKKKSRHGKEHRKKHKIQSTDEHVRHDRVAADVHQPEEISQTSEAKTGFKSIERNERQTSGAKTGFKSTERNERQTSEAKTGFKSIERNEHQHLEAKTGFKSTERNERQTSEAKTGFKSIERSERQYMEAQMVESKPVERHKSKSRDDFEQEIVFHVKSGDDGGQLLKSVSDVADGVISNQLNANEKFSNKSAKMHEPNSKQVFGSKEKKPLQTFLPDELASPDQEDPISRQSTYASISLKSSLASNQVQPVIPQTYQTHPSSSKSLNHQNLESGLKQDKTSWSRPEQHTATNQNVQQQQLQDQYSRSRSIQSADQSKKDDDPLFRLGQEINSRLSNDQKMPEGPSRFQSVQERDKKLHSERSQPVGDRDIRSRSDLFEERRSSEVDRRRDWNPRSESGKEKNEIRSKLEQLQERHMEDMKIIKKSNLDIVIPEPDLSQNKLRSSSDFDASRKSNVSHQNQSLNVVKEIPKAFSDRGKPWSGSEAESQPPGLQHADPATPDPDPFNFMNSVKRKFEAQFHRSDFINVDSSRDPVSEISMAISEGPLSTISSSSSSKVLNIVYDKSSKEKLPKDKWSNQIPLFGDDSGHTKEAKQQQHEHLFVPAALQLRFQAELNQLEGIQEAERQINHINHIREVVTARNDAAAMAQLLQQGLGRSLDETESSSKPVRRTSRSSSIGGETRAEFEARMKLHMEELLNKRMQKFLEQQTEATRATADAAKQLGKLFKTRKGESRNSEHRKIESRNTETRKGESRNTETRKGESRETETSGKNTELSEDILTLMSKAESNIPEVMSLAENTERSGGSIQRTISDAIRVLSVEEEQSTKSGDITEEIAGDLSSTATEIVATIMEQEKSTTSSRQTKVSTRKSKKDETLSEASIESSSSSSSEKGSTLTSSAESFSKFAGKLSRQNIQEQMTRLQHKMIMVDAKEKLLEERYKRELIKISQQAMESPDSDKNVRALKKRLVQSYRQRKAELDLLRESLRAEERDLKFLASQEKKLSRAGAKSSHLLAMSLDNENFLSPSPSSLSASFDGFSVLNVEANRKNKIGENVEPEKRKLVDRRTHRSEELRLSISGVPPLKPPLSPKASTSGIPRRRHHSSADSDESINISQADTVSDHSDLEICISALQAELRGCIRQAENLKRQRKKSVKAEQLKVQEDAHRQQVETFDKLIVTKLAELDEVVQPGQKASIVQPKIKVPRVSGRTTGLQPQMSVEAESPEFGDTSQKTFSSLSRASSTDTILASPKKLISEEVPDISIDISSDSLMVDMTDKSKFIPTSDELSENNVSPDSPHQVDTASQASQPSHTETILESPKKIAFDNSFSTKSQRPETRSVKEDEEPSESEIVSRTKASDASIEKSNSETFEREDETQDQSDKAESIPENIEEQTASQAVESDLNYSDDFTSSSSTSESNLVIKTTLRSKLPPDTTLQKTCQVDGSQKLDLVQGIKPAESKGEAFSIESEDKSDQFEPESEKTKIESQEIVIASYLGDMDVPKVFDKEPFKSEEASKKKDRDDLVEEICETILEELVHDALNTFTLARAKTLAPSSEAKSHNFGKDVKETDRNNHSIEDVKGNNISQVEQLQKRPQPPSIISPRSGKSIQELMLTTFDLSSDSSQDSGSEDSSIPTQYPPLTVALDKLSDRSTDINKLSDSSTGKSNLSDRSTDNNKLSDSSTGKSNLVESSTDIDKLLDSSTDFDGGDFIDDDFGLSIRQESEKLRQQQILIEQEISRIQQEKQAIPDKPPPPYTPPSSPRPTRTRPNLETTKFVPSTRQDIVNLVPGMVRSVLASRPEIASLLGKDNSDAGAKPRVEQTVVPTGPSRDKFISFLNDQVCDIIDDVYRCKSEKQNPPWMPRKPLEKEQLALPKSVPELIARVTREVLVAFHYEKRAAKENLVVRWSQKRRDRVDQILVRELHSEEAAWTNYSSDEAAVKDQLSEGLMDSLISDTVATFKRIFEARKNV